MSKKDELDELMGTTPAKANASNIDPFADAEDPEEVFQWDFEEDEDRFDVEPGVYDAECTKFRRGEVNAKGNIPMIFTFRLLGTTQTIQRWCYTNTTSRWVVTQTLRALGAGEGSIADFKRKDVTGKACRITVIRDTYEGKTRPKVDKVDPPTADTLRKQQLP